MAFDKLKCFTEEPVLMMPDQTRPFQIETDASKYATGAILTQLDANGDILEYARNRLPVYLPPLPVNCKITPIFIHFLCITLSRLSVVSLSFSP